MNSEPGESSGGRGRVSRQQDYRKSFHFGKTSRSCKARGVPLSPAVTRNSISEAPAILVTPAQRTPELTPASKSVRRPTASSRAKAQYSLTGDNRPSIGSPRVSVSDWREITERLTGKLEQVELGLEEVRRENSDLREKLQISENEKERQVADLTALIEKNCKRNEDELKNALEINKCQLESQRLEFKEEIRKLLAFKDPVTDSVIRNKDKTSSGGGG